MIDSKQGKDCFEDEQDIKVHENIANADIADV